MIDIKVVDKFVDSLTIFYIKARGPYNYLIIFEGSITISKQQILNAMMDTIDF